MIKVSRPPAPQQLTAQEAQRLTAVYLSDKKKAVWNQPYLRSALLEYSSSKCVYCESKLQDDGYLRVDHFFCREHHDHKVVEWDNLLPTCEMCNGKKSNLNAVIEPFIDPTHDLPKAHLRFANCALFGKDDKGRNTQRTLQMNLRFGERWFQITRAVHSGVESLSEKAMKATSSMLTSDIQDFSASLIALFKQAERRREYSAIVASSIKLDPRTSEIVDAAKALGVWSDAEDDLWSVIEDSNLS